MVNMFDNYYKIVHKMVEHPFYVIIDQKNRDNVNQVMYLCYLYGIYNLMIRDYVMAFIEFYGKSYNKNAGKLDIFESLYGSGYKKKDEFQEPYTEFYFTEKTPYILYVLNGHDYGGSECDLTKCVKLDFKNNLQRFEKMVNNVEMINFIRKRHIRNKGFQCYAFYFMRTFFNIKLTDFVKKDYVELVPIEKITLFDLGPDYAEKCIFDDKRMERVHFITRSGDSVLGKYKCVKTGEVIGSIKNCYEYCKTVDLGKLNICKTSRKTCIICGMSGHIGGNKYGMVYLSKPGRIYKGYL